MSERPYSPAFVEFVNVGSGAGRIPLEGQRTPATSSDRGEDGA